MTLICFYKSYSQQLDINLSPEGSFEKVFDQYGNAYNLSSLLIQNNSSGVTLKTTLLSCSSTSIFNLYFEDGCGMENTLDPVQNARRSVICKVFQDLSNFINSPLTTTGNKVNIWVRNVNSIGVSTTGFLGLASGFYNLPSSSTVGGIADSEIWKTIHAGVDSYSNVSAPLIPNSANAISAGQYYHGMVAFNFNNLAVSPFTPIVNWNTVLTTATPTGTYDLYTVALHEITHALGFASLINNVGNSKLGSNFKYFNRFDRFLKNNSTSSYLLTSTNTCSVGSMYDYSFNPLLNISILQPQTLPVSPCLADNTICGTAIKYFSSITIPVYTPNCFSNESSLSHFEDQCFNNPLTGLPYGNNSYFVMSNANGVGVTKRYLKPEERIALCDIGYDVKNIFGSSTTFSGSYNYGGATSCGGIVVAGINDGISATGSYSFTGAVSTGTTINNILISGSTLLINDRNATSFVCLEDITATSSISPNFGTNTTTVNFSSTVGGLHLLRYVPVSSSGQKGNITYVYVYVLEPNFGSCIPTLVSSCDLVKNGNFEQNSYFPSSLNQLNLACGWGQINSCDYFHHGSLNPNVSVPCNLFGSQNSNLITGNAYVGFGLFKSFSSPSIYREILKTKLTTPLIAGNTYQLSFDISIAEMSNSSIRPQAYLSTNGALLSLTTLPFPIANPAMLFTNPTFCLNPNGWETITFVFTATTGGEEYLYLGGITYDTLLNPNTFTPITTIGTTVTGCATVNPYNPIDLLSYNYIDNISLKPLGSGTFDLPATIACPAAIIPNLSNLLTALPTTGVFSGPGVVLSGGIYSFNPTISGVGIKTISYTYTNSSGCVITLNKNINVNCITSDNIFSFSSLCYNTSTQSSIKSFFNVNDWESHIGILVNGVPATPAMVTITPTAPLPAGITLNPNGTLTIAAGTLPIPSFQFYVDICITGTTICKHVRCNFTLNKKVAAFNDVFGMSLNGNILNYYSGAACTGCNASILYNDYVCFGNSSNPATIVGTPNVVLTQTSPNAGNIRINTTTGNIEKVPATPNLIANAYTLTYSICDLNSPTMCTNASVNIQVFNVITKMTNTSLIEKDTLQDISISPNPSKGIFNIHFSIPITDNINVSVFNILGQKAHEIFNIKTQDMELNLDNAPAGTYLLRFSNINNDFSKLVIKL